MRAIRDRIGLTQKQLADRMDKSVSYVSLLESNQRPPTERVLSNIRNAVALTPFEEAALAEFVQLPDPITQLVQHAVSRLCVPTHANELQQWVVHEDLLRILNAYSTLLQAHQAVAENNFQLARERFEKLLADPNAQALPATLRASAGLGLADVSLKQGKPMLAQETLNATCELMNGALSGTVQPLHAEAEAFQGMLNLRAGDYQTATNHMTKALQMYDAVAGTTGHHNSAVAVGRTKSYNRLALLALLRGDPSSAQSYCTSALAALREVSPDENDLTHPSRLRILALQAWTFAEESDFRDFNEAARLRALALDAYTLAEDAYGVAKTWLYIGDDTRLEIQAAIEEGEMLSGVARLDYFKTRLRTSHLESLVSKAIDAYRHAIAGFDRLGEALLLSRATRGLGDMRRYIALRDPEQSDAEFRESQALLQRALDLEKKANQQRRESGTLESLAKLEWDQGHFAVARDRFSDAIALLRSTAVQEDAAAIRKLRRCMRYRQVVNKELNAQANLPSTQLGFTPLSATWQDLCQRLAGAVADAIARSKVRPESSSSLMVGWTQRLYDLDAVPGQRLVAQSALSTSHELKPLKGRRPALSSDELAKASNLHIARYYACETRLRQAELSPSHSDAYFDICMRHEVAVGVREDTHARKRASEALRRLREYPNGYHLLVVEEPMPIHFFLKGDVALIELTFQASELDQRLKEFCQEPEAEVCFAFDDLVLIQALHEVFDEMKALAEMQGGTVAETIEWLTKLVGDADDLDLSKGTAAPAL